MMPIKKSTDIFDVIIETVLIAMIVLAPLAMGSVSPWARGALFLLALLLLAAWLMQGAYRGELRVARCPAWVFIGAFFIVALLQLVPLSPGILKAVSANTAGTYVRTLTDYPASGEARTLSLSVYESGSEIIRMTTLFIVFFIVINVVRTRWQVVGIILAFVAVGSFEALYGFAEQFSGHKHIFWIPRQWHLAAVTGTFHNKNHFAGLLEIIVPVSLGLLLAIGKRSRRKAYGRSKETPVRARLASSLSSTRVYQQAILAALSVTMIVAIFFSLSRAGIISAGFSFIGLVAFLGLSSGFRRYTLVMFLIVAIILAVAAGIGMELVVTGIEDAVYGQSTSWLARVDLAKSALKYIRDYPLLGSGLGTFAIVFPRYQSAHSGDRMADYLHNDWLQLFCETGVVGAVIIVAGLGVFLAGVIRATLARRDAFCRWIAAGALLGAGAMLIHSLFDYNLTKITSNGIVFSTTLALAYVAANMPGKRSGTRARMPYRIVPLKPAPVRVLAALLALGVVALGPFIPCTSIKADMYFNRHLADPAVRGETESYFFLKVEKSGAGSDAPVSAQDNLALAMQADKRNFNYLYYKAWGLVRDADALVEQKALRKAREIVGEEIEDKDPEGFSQITALFEETLSAQMSDERMPYLSEAETLLRKAVSAAPTKAEYHLFLADIIGERDPASPEASLRAETARWLAPNKPAVLYESGRILLSQVMEHKPLRGNKDALGIVQEQFRRALYADPSYASRIYPLVEMAVGSREALLAVTPRTLGAYERLCDAFWKENDWHNVLICLDTIEKLVQSRESFHAHNRRFTEDEEGAYWDAGSAEGFSSSALAYDRRTPLEINLSVYQRRSTVLGILGRWAERAGAAARYRTLLGDKFSEEVAEARSLRGKGRSREAMAIYLNVLRQNWGNTEVLLDSAEVALLPRVLEGGPEWNTPLDYLYRMVINNDELSQEEYNRAVAILDKLILKKSMEKLRAGFIRGAGAILCDRTEEGIKRLEALAERDDEAAQIWPQRHLIWYYLGLGREKLGEGTKAAEEYRKVIESVPTHGPSLRRLSYLDADFASRLDDITPDVLCNINFGGKIILLGYELSQESAPVESDDSAQEHEPVWCITYYWRFNERMYRENHPIVHFYDDTWKILFRNNHRIYSGEKPYPMDFVRSGEVVVDKQRLTGKVNEARYLRIDIWAMRVNEYKGGALYPDTGTCLFGLFDDKAGQ